MTVMQLTYNDKRHVLSVTAEEAARLVEAAKAGGVVMRIGVSVKLGKIIACREEYLVEIFAGEGDGGGGYVGNRLDRVVGKEVGDVGEGGGGDHILVKVGVRLASEAGLEWVAVFDVTNDRL